MAKFTLKIKLLLIFNRLTQQQTFSSHFTNYPNALIGPYKELPLWVRGGSKDFRQRSNRARDVRFRKIFLATWDEWSAWGKMLARTSFRRLAVIVFTTYKERPKKACVYMTHFEKEKICLSWCLCLIENYLQISFFFFLPVMSVTVLIHLVLLPYVSLLSPSLFPQHYFIPSLGELLSMFQGLKQLCCQQNGVVSS